MKKTNGSVLRIYMLLNDYPVVYDTLRGSFYGKKVDIDGIHNILGCCGSDRLEKTAKIYNSNLNDDFKTFEQCSIAKSRQNNVKKG
jgi:hypothetical protein